MSTPHSFFEADFKSDVGSIVSGSQFNPETKLHFKALRLKNGESIAIMDGHGQLYKLKCLDNKIWSFVLNEVITQKKPEPEIFMYLSPPKGEALSLSVSQLTEMGVTNLIFLRTDHSQYSLRELPPVDRAQRIADAAAEQCSRARRLHVHKEWLNLEKSFAQHADVPNFVADETLAEAPFSFDDMAEKTKGHSRLKAYIGPEGGWSEAERHFFDAHGGCRISLGFFVLRVPTACAAFVQTLNILSSFARNR